MTELREDFERNGFVVFDPGIPTEVLDGAVADLDDDFLPRADRQRVRALRVARRLLRRPARERFGYADHNRIADAWVGSRSVRAIARAPKVLELLRALYGREPLPFQTLNFRKGTQQDAHADAFHFNSQPSGFMCGVWVALEDVDDAAGPLVYYPGSHRLPELGTPDIPMRPTQEEYSKYEAHVRELIERKGLEPRRGLLRKGEALLWASNLLHGGAPQEDIDRTRRSQVTHYFFADCRYWTPMLSSREVIKWRKPAWIT